MLLTDIPTTEIPWTEVTTALVGIAVVYLRKLVTKISQVNAQVIKNGGKSLADAVARIESKIVELTAMNIVERQLDERPMFKTDEKGDCVWVNVAYKEIVNMTLDDLKGNGWVSIVSEEDRPRVKTEWQSSIQDKRKFIMKYSLSPIGTSKNIPVKCKAFPIIIEGALKGYYGIIYVQHDNQSNNQKVNLDE